MSDSNNKVDLSVITIDDIHGVIKKYRTRPLKELGDEISTKKKKGTKKFDTKGLNDSLKNIPLNHLSDIINMVRPTPAPPPVRQYPDDVEMVQGYVDDIEMKDIYANAKKKVKQKADESAKQQIQKQMVFSSKDLVDEMSKNIAFKRVFDSFFMGVKDEILNNLKNNAPTKNSDTRAIMDNVLRSYVNSTEFRALKTSIDQIDKNHKASNESLVDSMKKVAFQNNAKIIEIDEKLGQLDENLYELDVKVGNYHNLIVQVKKESAKMYKEADENRRKEMESITELVQRGLDTHANNINTMILNNMSNNNENLNRIQSSLQFLEQSVVASLNMRPNNSNNSELAEILKLIKKINGTINGEDKYNLDDLSSSLNLVSDNDKYYDLNLSQKIRKLGEDMIRLQDIILKEVTKKPPEEMDTDFHPVTREFQKLKVLEQNQNHIFAAIDGLKDAVLKNPTQNNSTTTIVKETDNSQITKMISEAQDKWEKSYNDIKKEMTAISKNTDYTQREKQKQEKLIQDGIDANSKLEESINRAISSLANTNQDFKSSMIASHNLAVSEARLNLQTALSMAMTRETAYNTNHLNAITSLKQELYQNHNNRFSEIERKISDFHSNIDKKISNDSGLISSLLSRFSSSSNVSNANKEYSEILALTGKINSIESKMTLVFDKCETLTNNMSQLSDKMVVVDRIDQKFLSEQKEFLKKISSNDENTKDLIVKINTFLSSEKNFENATEALTNLSSLITTLGENFKADDTKNPKPKDTAINTMNQKAVVSLIQSLKEELQRIADQNKSDIDISKNALNSTLEFMNSYKKEIEKRKFFNMTDANVGTEIYTQNEEVQTERIALVNNETNTIAKTTSDQSTDPVVDQAIAAASSPQVVNPPTTPNTSQVITPNTPVNVSPAITIETKSISTTKEPDDTPMVNQEATVNLLPITSNDPSSLNANAKEITKKEFTDKNKSVLNANKEKKRQAFVDSFRASDPDLFDKPATNLDELLNEKTKKQIQLKSYREFRFNQLKPLLDILQKINDNYLFDTGENHNLNNSTLRDLKTLVKEGNELFGSKPFETHTKIAALAYVVQNQSEYNLMIDVLDKIRQKTKNNRLPEYTKTLDEALQLMDFGGYFISPSEGGYFSHKRTDALTEDPFNDTYRFNASYDKTVNKKDSELLPYAIDHLVYALNTVSGDSSAQFEDPHVKLDVLRKSVKRELSVLNKKYSLFASILSHHSLLDANTVYEDLLEITDYLSAYYKNSIDYLSAPNFKKVADSTLMKEILEILGSMVRPIGRATVVIKNYQTVTNDSEQTMSSLVGPQEKEESEKRKDDDPETVPTDTVKSKNQKTMPTAPKEKNTTVKFAENTDVIPIKPSDRQSRGTARDSTPKRRSLSSTARVPQSVIDKKEEEKLKKQNDSQMNNLADMFKNAKGSGIHDVIHNHSKRLKKYHKIKNAPHLEYPKSYTMNKMIDDHLEDYDKNVAEPKDVLCEHCGKGIASPNKDDENNKMHLANTGEIMHKKCFEQKGGTPKRVLYKKAKGYDIELNSPDPKAKQLAEQQELYRSHKDMENVEFPTLWDDFLESSKSYIKNPNNLIEAAHTRDIFLGKFSERRFNEMVFLIGYHNNHLEEDDEMISHNLEIATAKYLMNKKYKSTYRTHLPVSNFEKLKKTLIAEPGILRNLDF